MLGVLHGTVSNEFHRSFKGLSHEDIAVLGQFYAEVSTKRLYP